MRYRAIIMPEAEDDLEKAFSWYEEKRRGLGYDFLLQVDAGLRFIERNPNIFPPEYKGARKYLMPKSLVGDARSHEAAKKAMAEIGTSPNYSGAPTNASGRSRASRRFW